MGKEYATELRLMAETYAWARTADISALVKFAKKSAKLPLIAVGSGGSVTAAETVSLLHPAVSRTMTTYEFMQSDISGNYAVLLISAGGKNRDILAAYEKAVRMNPKVLGIVCANQSGDLVRLAKINPHVFLHAITPPTGMDGFLATNTLLATVVWLFRAWGCDIPLSLHNAAYGGKPLETFDASISDSLKKYSDVDNLLILYDKYGRPAAVDAESKLHEAGIISVQLADYRNFAHGRHNWIDKHPNTLLLALVTPGSIGLATATIEKLPDHVNRCGLHSGFNGPISALNLLVAVFHTVKFFGRVHGIDPGRPSPPSFARELYGMDVLKYVTVDE